MPAPVRPCTGITNEGLGFGCTKLVLRLHVRGGEGVPVLLPRLRQSNNAIEVEEGLTALTQYSFVESEARAKAATEAQELTGRAGGAG